MANSHLAVQFWNWSTPGPYFGMPISNLLGWSCTGLLYMSVSRLLWREQLDARRIVAWLPFGMYVANTGFAMLLSLGSGLWQPSVIAVVLGLFPATAVFWFPRASGDKNERVGKGVACVSHLAVYIGSAFLLGRRVICQVEGLEHLPAQGPVLIAARHVHHLYDGCALLTAVPRRLHLLVGLDWIQRPLVRDLLEQCCGLVEWPVVLRAERLNGSTRARTSAYQASEARGYLRRAIALSLKLLHQGEVLVIFPEAYPLIDPHPGSREAHQTFLPFQPGFAHLVELAERDGKTRVALIPAGLTYTRQDRTWQLLLRLGPALFRQDFSSRTRFIETVEQQVQALSTPADLASCRHTPTFIRQEGEDRCNRVLER
jgi:putative membrane protein